MEKSIESIWKEGFINNDNLIAPKVINLYDKKSEHIVDKFSRMFRINLIAIVIGSFFILAMAFLVKIPFMGIGMFIILNATAYVNNKLRKGLTKIDKNENSFQYLRTFNSWMKEQTSVNEKFSRIIYPFIFISIVAGFWFGPIGGDIPGNNMVNEVMLNYPSLSLLFGVPILMWLLGVVFIILLVFFGGKIYRWDLNLVYGSVLKKLDEIIKDMEELRS